MSLRSINKQNRIEGAANNYLSLFPYKAIRSDQRVEELTEWNDLRKRVCKYNVDSFITFIKVFLNARL